MNHSPNLASTKVAILGLGLMGGSIALALRGKVATTLAYDPDPGTLEMALQNRVVDRASQEPTLILSQADLVLLCAPVSAILEWIEKLPALHPGRAVVLDIGSTKVQICEALKGLPERFDPLGGHPMCGKTVPGLEYADPAIFHGAKFAFTPLERTTLHARTVAEELAGVVGAVPLWLDPYTHDQWVASTSHLPYLLSCALSLATPPEAAPLVGPGFRSTSRLATSSMAMITDILNTNRKNILAALERFSTELDRIGMYLSDENLPADLIESLQLAANRQRELVGANSIPNLKEPQR